MEKKQKFNKGDRIMIAKFLGSYMSHFANDCEAIVEYTYSEKFGGDNIDSYSLHIKGKGSSAWYEEHQLTLIEKDRPDLLALWEKQEQDEEILKSDIDWIFENSEDVIKNPHGASVQTLAKMLGCDNLWGSNGEGMTYFQNSMAVLSIANTFLELSDKQGFIEHCENLKRSKKK